MKIKWEYFIRLTIEQAHQSLKTTEDLSRSTMILGVSLIMDRKDFVRSLLSA